MPNCYNLFESGHCILRTSTSTSIDRSKRSIGFCFITPSLAYCRMMPGSRGRHLHEEGLKRHCARGMNPCRHTRWVVSKKEFLKLHVASA